MSSPPSDIRFENAKSVSSDQYFERKDDAEQAYLTQERLRQVQGSTAISSDQFFGTEEEESPGILSGTTSGGMTKSILQVMESLFSPYDGWDEDNDEPENDGQNE